MVTKAADAKFERLLNLAAVLDSSPRPLNARELRERVGGYAEGEAAFRRSFERDKEDLLALGFPLRTTTLPTEEGTVVAYTLERRLADPGLSPAELAALRVAATTLALRDDDLEDVAGLSDGLRKLGGLAGAASEERAATVGEIKVDLLVGAVFRAITSGREIRFRHSGRERRIVPRRLILRRGHWYVAGFDLERGEPRTFRLDRIEAGVELGGEAAGADLGAELPADVLSVRPWEFGTAEAVTTHVLLDPEVVPLALVDDSGLSVAEERPGGAVVVELAVRNPAGLWNWLLGFLDRAELLDPPELRAAWIAELSTLAGDPKP